LVALVLITVIIDTILVSKFREICLRYWGPKLTHIVVEKSANSLLVGIFGNQPTKW